MARGTEIVLHLKPEAKKYLEAHEIERIVGAYSDNIQFPIELVPEDGEPRQIAGRRNRLVLQGVAKGG
mgnify:CR=1 FL=1